MAVPARSDEEGQLVLFEGAGEEIPAPAPRLRELVEIPVPPLARVARLSYSAISLFDRCGYRYYAERIVGMQPAPWEPRIGADGPGGLHPTEIGDAVHRLLELVDLASPAAPGEVELELLVRSWYPTVSAEEIARIGELVRSYTGSALAARIAGLRGVRPERPFAFELDEVLVNGRLDVLWLEGERALVLDYKTNALLGRDPAEIVEEEYLTQQIVYAIACLRAGATEVEVVYHFLEDPDAVVSRVFTAEDAPRLEGVLSASIARIRAGEFRPTPSAFACSGCPALNVVCAGPRLGGLDEVGCGFSPRLPAYGSAEASSLSPCGSQRCTTFTATCRRSRPCSPTRAWPKPISSSAAETSSPARCRRHASICSVRSARGSRSCAGMPIATSSGTARRMEAPGALEELGPERLAVVAEWPLTIELDVAGGTTFCHATPRFDDDLVTRLTPDDELAAVLAGTPTHLVVAGHTHMQVDRLAGGHRFVVAGSVGRPYEGRQGAFWALLGDDVELLRTDYDVESAAGCDPGNRLPGRR